MKKLIALSLIFLSSKSYSQDLIYYKVLDIGTSANSNTVSGDANIVNRSTSINFNVGYNINTYLNLIGSVQTGTLSGGEINNPYGKPFKNDFKAVSFYSQFQLGLLNNKPASNLLKAARNLYAGLGIGAIANKVTEVIENNDPYNQGKTNSINLFIPLRLGYEIKIKNSFNENRYKIDFGYQYNYTLGDDIDGYKSGKSNDSFSQIFLGLKVGISGDRRRYSY